MKYEITITASPDPADDQFVRSMLFQYNLLHTDDDRHQWLAVFARDDGGAITGGLLGDTYWDWLHVDILWVREDARGQGLGKRLLAAAEAEAVRRGCRHAHLDTLDFQAPDFYLRQGYTVWGVLEDLPPGHRRIFLKKDL